MIPCPDCEGTGRVESPGLEGGVAECGTCDGSGEDHWQSIDTMMKAGAEILNVLEPFAKMYLALRVKESERCVTAPGVVRSDSNYYLRTSDLRAAHDLFMKLGGSVE